MSDYVILTESSSDISLKIAKDNDIQVMPMDFILEGKSYAHYADSREMDVKAFYQKLRDGAVVTTAAENVEDYMTWVKPLLEEGKDVLLVVFSSGLSSTFSTANVALAELREQYPDRKILAVDSLCASAGEAMLAYYAAQNRAKGMSIEENAQWLEENKLHLAHWFTVDDLMFLKRGGRVSSATALVGTMLSIKPVLHVDDAGHLINVGKARGRKASMKALADHAAETGVDLRNQVLFISHGDCLEDAQWLAQEVRDRFHPVDVVISDIGPVIGAHSGPGTLALYFMATHR